MSNCPFNVYMGEVIKELKMGMGRGGSEISRGGKRVEIA